MQQYESSTATLRAILSHPSLQRSKIDATLDALAEASFEQRSIDEAIRAGMQGVNEFEASDEEVQAELAALVAEAQSDSERSRKEREELRALEDTSVTADALPSVPSGTLIRADSVGQAEGSHADNVIDTVARTPIAE